MQTCPCAPRLASFESTVRRDLVIYGICLTLTVLLAIAGWNWNIELAFCLGAAFTLLVLAMGTNIGNNAPQHDCPPEIRPCPRVAFDARIRKEWISAGVIAVCTLAAMAAGIWVVDNGYLTMFSGLFLLFICAAAANIGDNAPSCSCGMHAAA